MNMNDLIFCVLWHMSYVAIYVTACGDIQESFSINSIRWITHKKRCSWANEGKKWKCSISEIQMNCPSTCNLCPTVSPAPTISAKIEVTKSPSQIPPSQIPERVIQIGPFSVPEVYIEVAAYVAIILLVLFLSCYRSGDGNKRKPSGTRTRRRGRNDNRYDGTHIGEYYDERYIRPSMSDNRRERDTNRARR